MIVQKNFIALKVTIFYFYPITAIQQQLYLSPTETYCMNIDYYLTGDENSTADFTTDEHTKLCKYIEFSTA